MGDNTSHTRQQYPLRQHTTAHTHAGELDIIKDSVKYISTNVKIYRPLTSPAEEGGGKIQLLTLLPGKQGSKMCCELREESLDELPAYEALSYVWGSPTLSRLIWVNGKILAITRNLEVALEHSPL